MFAKVVVDVKIDNIKSNNLNETYDYIIPMSLSEFVGVGSRVLVPFGNQDLLGYVLEINENNATIEKVTINKEEVTAQDGTVVVEIVTQNVTIEIYLAKENRGYL